MRHVCSVGQRRLLPQAAAHPWPLWPPMHRLLPPHRGRSVRSGVTAWYRGTWCTQERRRGAEQGDRAWVGPSLEPTLWRTARVMHRHYAHDLPRQEPPSPQPLAHPKEDS